MTHTTGWPCRVAAIFAVVAGGFLLLGGWGHLSAVLETRAGQPFDFRFVSLVTTSGILMFPGVVSVGTSYWLWHGRTWAYVSCVLSVSALTLYLTLLIYMKLRLPVGAETAAGDEVYAAGGLAIIYLVLMLSVLLWLHAGRKHQLSAA